MLDVGSRREAPDVLRGRRDLEVLNFGWRCCFATLFLLIDMIYKIDKIKNFATKALRH